MDRSFKTAFPPPFLKDYQSGTLRYTYRDVPCLKSPIDIGIYLKALWDLKPRTIIEIGSKHGGSALLFADVSRMLGLDAHVYSIDLAQPKGVTDDRITFLTGDVNDLGAVFNAAELHNLPHPWFIVEDSAHSYAGCLAALHFLHPLLHRNDLLVMEDGVLDDLGLTERYDGGPNRAIAQFFAEQSDVFTVDTDLCDMFGPNATYSPNGFLRKT